jgi:anti-anti-sigma factor
VLLLSVPDVTGAEVLGTVRGAFDAETVEALRATVPPLLASAPERVVVDCSAATLVGRSGVRTLVALRRRCASAGVPFVLRSPSSSVRRGLQTGHLARFFEIEA